MNFGFKLDRMINGSKCKVYAIKYDNKEENEFINFASRKEIRNHPEFPIINEKLNQIANVHGNREDWFRNESEKGENPPVKRVFLETEGMLRLYCIRWSSYILIVGDGSIKPPGTRTYQETPELYAKVKKIEQTFEKLEQYCIENRVTIEEIIEEIGI